MEPLQILILHEKEDVLNFLISVLRPDYIVNIADTGLRALEILNTNRIDLVISDVRFSGTGGVEFCRDIKTGSETNHIPILLLDSKSTLQSRVRSLELGADAYVEIPVCVEFLRAQVKNLIENRKRVLEYFSRVPLVAAMMLARNREDQLFVENVVKQITINLDNSDFGMAELAEATNVSRITLYRKVKAFCSMTPMEFIHITRLKKGAELLASKHYRIYEVAIMVGYKSQTQFGRVFQKQFGVSPRQFIESLEK